MIALDTNLLVYAHRRDAPFHQQAAEVLARCSESGRPWGIPFHVLIEFLGVVTHPRIWKTAMPMSLACTMVADLRRAPGVRILADNDTTLSLVTELAQAAQISGPMIHEARIAACCLGHGVRELWSCDRDFSRYPKLRVRNPLIP